MPFRTIADLLVEAAERDAGRTWLRTDALTLSFEAAVGWVAQAAGALRDRGLQRGDLVLLTPRNTPAYLTALLAICSCGAIAVTGNPAATAAELEGLLDQASPAMIVSDAELAATLRALPRAHAARLGMHDVDTVTGAPPPAAGAPPLRPDARPDDVAVLIPTSGTTGRSKLVMQTHRAYAMAGEGFPDWMELTRDDVLMTSLPLFHINAPAYTVMGSLACGAGLALLPRFSASGFIDAARRHGATEFNAIGAMLEMLMRQPERPDDADTPLRLCYAGPSPSQPRQEEIERRFGMRIVCGWGMSETPYGLIWRRGTRPFGTLGSVRQHPTMGIVNHARVVDDDGTDVDIGGTGELLMCNPAVTPGYWGMPEETARVIVDGWLHTGDLVTANADGTYAFVARKKEVIRRRGENLSPLEVEEVLAEHPAVLECAVVGVPSELSEEEVKAFVVPVPGAALDIAELRDFASRRLTAFKVPRYWQKLGALPRTPTGRVAKAQLPQGHPDDETDTGGDRSPRSAAAQEAP